MELKKVKISEIRPYANNPRKNNQAVDAVADSIRQCEYIAPIIVDENMEVLAGHTRLKALKKLGRKTAEVVIKEGLTDEQKRKFRLLDNKTNELADWDIEALAIEIEGLDFDGLELDWGLSGFVGSEYEEEPEDFAESTQRRVENILNLGLAQFESDGRYDIPMIQGIEKLPEIKEWIGFNYVMSDSEPAGKGVHFFVDDYQFERVWNEPDRYIEKLSQYEAVLAPDFSPYGDMPFTLQLYNHYRKHWCAAYWQMNGITVIPTIRSSTDPRSYGFYLDGEPRNSVVAISTMWAKNTPEENRLEYENMVDVLDPSQIIVYGSIQDYMDESIIVRVPAFAEKYRGE